MNERIRELVRQASKLANTDDNKDFDRNFDMIVAEKFAELIVKECIEIAQDRANFPGFPPNDVNDIIDEIREHFGVEE